MSKLRVHCFAISLDGYAAGPEQSLDHPLGDGGLALFDWMFATRTARSRMFAQQGGETGIDDDFTALGFENVGAWVMGRNMFGPVRGPWTDETWRGWWGPNPPFHVPVFVLTHYERRPISMEGGTSFHFVTGGIESALHQAAAAARGKDIRLGGGVATIRQFLRVGLIDELHLAISPLVLGSGEALFTGIDLPQLGYRCTKHAPGIRATHVVLAR
jgi:dihydrofolate reductase